MRGDLEQPIPIKRPIGVLGEDFEKIIFARRECFLATVARIDKDALLEVENPSTQPDARSDGWYTACRTPQHALDSGQELARIERLADIVVGTRLQSRDTVDRIGSGGAHKYAEPAAVLPQTTCHSEPTPPRV